MESTMVIGGIFAFVGVIDAALAFLVIPKIIKNPGAQKPVRIILLGSAALMILGGLFAIFGVFDFLLGEFT